MPEIIPLTGDPQESLLASQVSSRLISQTYSDFWLLFSLSLSLVYSEDSAKQLLLFVS